MAARTDMSHDPLRLAWRRFRANRLAAVSALLLILLTGISLISLPFSMRWYNVQSLDEAVRHSPSVQPIVAAENFVDHTADATTLKPAASAAHQASSWLGHDDLGRSLLYRLLPGFLISMLIGVLAAVLAVGLGTCWGAVAGQIGGHVDMVMMRIVDMLYGLPYVLMVILLKVGLQRPVTALLGDNTQLANVAILIIAIGSVSWLTVARVVRGPGTLAARTAVRRSRPSRRGDADPHPRASHDPQPDRPDPGVRHARGTASHPPGVVLELPGHRRSATDTVAGKLSGRRRTGRQRLRRILVADRLSLRRADPLPDGPELPRGRPPRRLRPQIIRRHPRITPRTGCHATPSTFSAIHDRKHLLKQELCYSKCAAQERPPCMRRCEIVS